MAEEHKHGESRAEPLVVSVVSCGLPKISEFRPFWLCWAAGEVEAGVGRERRKEKKNKEGEEYEREREICRLLSIK